MKFSETQLAGGYLIDLERCEDERGFFARSWCADEFSRHGLCPQFVQCNISFNPQPGTLRGLHYQTDPHAEVKLVRCTRGSIHDVIVDLRADSPTFMRHEGFTLSAASRQALYVPKGFAHGFLTLEADTEVFYQVSTSYQPTSERGVRWNDEVFSIDWPAPILLVSEKDNQFPSFNSCSVSS
ncbi:MAG: dTDP-4-dehydrorhamnose 3,5-epimerase [Pirellulales bacterium]